MLFVDMSLDEIEIHFTFNFGTFGTNLFELLQNSKFMARGSVFFYDFYIEDIWYGEKKLKNSLKKTFESCIPEKFIFLNISLNRASKGNSYNATASSTK